MEVEKSRERAVQLEARLAVQAIKLENAEEELQNVNHDRERLNLQLKQHQGSWYQNAQVKFEEALRRSKGVYLDSSGGVSYGREPDLA
eukprot:gene7607-9059_t